MGLWQALKALKHISQPTKRPLINQRSKSQLTAQPAIVPPTRNPRPPPNRSARVVITASAVQRGTKRVDLKAIVDRALLLSGGAGYRAGTPLARAVGDVRALMFMNPLNTTRASSYLADLALGVSPQLG